MRTGSRLRTLPALLAAAALCLLASRASAVNPGGARAAHTATLLPTGDVLVAGGVDAAGTRLKTAELVLSSKGNTYIAVGNMSVARASATATVLPNGLVLIAGGVDTTPSVRNDVEVYDPATRTFGGVVAFQSGHTHYSHTATLLNNGSVLICGGMDTLTTVTTVCDYYTPTGTKEPNGATCAAPAGSGCTSAAPSMAAGRAHHTATLLKDGKVLFAGGWNPLAAATNGFLTTMEKFDPASGGSFGSAAALFEARGYHTATLMGDGKVLIAGGFNGKEVAGNRGILDTEEIYDPVADQMTPAPQLNTRRLMHTAVLSADGSVVFFGGLGNITTTYQSQTSIPANFAITDTYSGQLSTGNMTTGAKTFSFSNGLLLSQPVVGTIVEGTVVFSTPSLDFTSGVAYFVPGDPSNTAVGLQANMAGVAVTCNPTGTCGFIDSGQVMPMTNLNQGKVFFKPLSNLSGTGNGTSGSLAFPGGGLTVNSPPVTLTSAGSQFTIDSLSIPMPVNTIGATLTAGTLHVVSASFTQMSSYTVTLTGTNDIDLSPTGALAIANGGPLTVVEKDDFLGNKSAVVETPPVTFTGVAGTLTPLAQSGNAPITSPIGVNLSNAEPVVSLTFDVKYVPSLVDVTGLSIVCDISTVIVHSMVFGSPETFIPSKNQAALSQADGSAYSQDRVNERFGHTATLMPNNDMLLVGGLDCSSPNAGCGSLVAQQDDNVFFGNAAFPRLDTTYVIRNKNSASAGSLLKARALHTATLLPNGKILVAGGTDGPNILSSAEVYDPATGNSVATVGGMRDDRDLHTATLLPDGRVLIAGGFTTNATSTDSISASEIYYPDTSIFVPTGAMTIPRRGHTATLLPDGTVLAVGGLTTGGGIVGSAEIYRSTTSAWEATAVGAGGTALPARTGHTATLLKDGTVLVVGGLDALGALSTVYRFDPAKPASRWTAQASLPHALYQHTATLLFDGRVLVAGGNDGFGEVNASYLYDPQANTWTLTDPSLQTPLLQPRYGHTATLLPNDTVMISGGNTKFGIVPNEIEVYHVNASTWAAGGVHFVDGPRTFHTMTLAADGNVYALGGGNGAIGGTGTSLYTSVDRSYFTTSPDAFTKNAPPSFRQSSITTATPAIFQAGPTNTFTVTGIQFRGATEASGGGAGSANSSFSFPHLILQQIDGSGGGSSQSNSGFVVDLTTQVYLNSNNFQNLDSSLTVALPTLAAQLPIGWYNARVGANDLYSNGAFVQAGPAKPSLAPAIASGTAMGISSITWTWSSVPTIGVAGVPGVVDGYNVYESSGGVFLGTAAAAAFPTFVQTGLPPNSTEQITVAAYSISGDGPGQFSAPAYTLSTSPINISIASVTFNSLLLQWSTNGNAPGTIYEVSESTDGFVQSFSTPVPTLLGLTTTFVTITGLVNNTTYSLRLRAFNTAGLPSGFSAVVSTQTRSSVSSVGCGPTASGDTTTSIQWSWSDAGTGVTYKIFDSSSGFQIGTAGATDSFSDVGLGTNTQRSIEVLAHTPAGDGPLSVAATCYTLAATPAQGSPLMTSTETTSVSLNWTANGNPTGTVYQAVFNSFVSTTVTVTTITSNGFQAYLSPLIPSDYYTAQIVALNGSNFPSVPLIAGTTYTLPAQPQPLAIQGTTPVSISVSWNTNFNSTMTYYQLTYSVDNFVTNIATAVFFSNHYSSSSFTIPNLLTSTQYWIRVQAENPFGQVSPFAAAVTTITSNGGATPGSLAGTLSALGVSEFSGNLGGPSGRFIAIRSPGGAFPTDTTVSISTYGLADHGGTLCPGGIPGFGGTDGVALSIVNSPALQPTHPIFLTGSYTNAEAASFPVPASQVSLARFDPASGTCVPLQTSFDTAAQTFVAQLNHFSLYQLVAVPLFTSADTARIYPNPYRAATDGYITIDQIPPAAHVRVFTLRGERILDATANGAGNVTWSADNTAGRPVASGLYLVVVEAGGTKKIMKLAVIR